MIVPIYAKVSHNIINPITNRIIQEYEDDKNYSKFRHGFMKTSKSEALCLVSVPRLLFEWIVRVCCHVLLLAWCER
jgi:hypothetical protein